MEIKHLYCYQLLWVKSIGYTMKAHRNSLMLILVLVSYCGHSEEPTAEILLKNLVAEEGESYFKKRDDVLSDKRGVDTILGLEMTKVDVRRMQWILGAWSQNEKAFREKLAYMDECEVRQRGSRSTKLSKLSPHIEFFCAGQSSMLEESRKLVPLMVEITWKYKGAEQKLWRKIGALGTIRYYGNATQARFCLDQVPSLENDSLADAAVDTALVLSEGSALKELEILSKEEGVPGKKFRDALARLACRQEALRQKMQDIITSAKYKERYPDPFHNIAQSKDLGVFYTLEKPDTWQLELCGRIIIGAWKYKIPERVNLYGPFLHYCDISGNRDFKTVLGPKDRDKVLKDYKPQARELVPIIIRCLWCWTEIMDDSRKLVLIELLASGADQTVLLPMIDVLTREKSEPVIRALCAMLLRIAPDEVESEIEKWKKDKPDSADSLDLALKTIRNLRK